MFQVEYNPSDNSAEFQRLPDGCGDPVDYQMWEVKIYVPSGGGYFLPPILCLAPSGKDAVMQVTPFNVGSDLYSISVEGSTFVRRDFLIRGWGSRIF